MIIEFGERDHVKSNISALHDIYLHEGSCVRFCVSVG